MKVAVIGLGHVGLVTAACFSQVGHDVIGVDVDGERVEGLRRGRMPFFEPGLAEMVEAGVRAGRLDFATDPPAAAGVCGVLFICVGTPPAPDGSSDLLQLERLICEIAEGMDGYRVLVEKSTVPVSTYRRVARTMRRLGRGSDFDVVSNPEFLREGSAIADTLEPTRIVVGSTSERATTLVMEVYRPIVRRTGCPVIVTDVGTAELIKLASNAFLATKISFANALAEICETTGADVEAVTEGMGLDPRIGPQFLRAGMGYGGSCLPKDVAAFLRQAEDVGYDFGLLREVRRANERAPQRIVEKLRAELWHLRDKTIAVLGLAFKPGTDDLREAPALRVVDALQADGARVVVYDPAAMSAAKEVLHDVRLAPSPLDALTGADAAVVATEWDEFRSLDPDEIRRAMRFPIVVDGRNIFHPEAMRRAGFTYLSVGRPPVWS